MKQIPIILLFLITSATHAQVKRDSDLFKEFKKQDSIFFERGFNQCDLEYLEDHVANDLKPSPSVR